MNSLRILIAVSSIVLVAACNEPRMFEDSHTFSDEKWSAGEAAIFRVPVTDTVSPHRFFVTLRNGGQYPYSNLFLFLTTIFPDSTLAVDTIELMLSDHTGKWLGSGSGGVYEHRILFDDNVIFPDTGTYTFVFNQGMRMEQLPHILDAGIRIEKQ